MPVHDARTENDCRKDCEARFNPDKNRPKVMATMKVVWNASSVCWLAIFCHLLLHLVTGNIRNSSDVITTTIRCRGAIARIHHKDDSRIECRSNIAILAVGTAMKTQDYDLLAQAIVKTSSDNAVVVILDFNPYDPLKLSPAAYARAVDALVEEKLETVLPLCNDSLNIFVGGHSAGGSSALEALVQDMFQTTIAGYVGLDPYLVRTDGDLILIPAIHWGFESTTCRVSVENAAKAAYERSKEGFRVFYRLSEPYSHCCFTNAGCMWVCSCAKQSDHLLHDIGISFDQFVSATLERSRFQRNRFSTRQFKLQSSEFTLLMDQGRSIQLYTESEAIFN